MRVNIVSRELHTLLHNEAAEGSERPATVGNSDCCMNLDIHVLCYVQYMFQSAVSCDSIVIVKLQTIT